MCFRSSQKRRSGGWYVDFALTPTLSFPILGTIFRDLVLRSSMMGMDIAIRSNHSHVVGRADIPERIDMEHVAAS